MINKENPLIIHIDVARADNGNAEKKGTFKEPWPLVKVANPTYIQWRIKNGKQKDSFIVSFPNGSPFPGVTAINQATAPLEACIEGEYHYQVFVTDGDSGEIFPIHNCPELNVDPSEN